MFVWTTRGRKAFKTIPKDQIERITRMAVNQVLYNVFFSNWFDLAAVYW
jgi:uncharacterized membrane protein